MGKKSKILASALLILAVLVVAGWYFSKYPLAVFDPAGPVAAQERHLIVLATLLMLLVVIPVFVLTIFITWKYRESGKQRGTYSPDWDHNRAIEAVWWLIPSALIVLLSVVTWRSTHALDPYKPLDSTKKQLTVQVIALDWRWLFIYPAEHVASLNSMPLPVDTPIDLQVTADAPMNSLWIPRLSGQIYAMPGMSTQLHILASKTGNYRGSSANISGSGFADMSFTAQAMDENTFQVWLKTAHNSSLHLSLATYNQLAEANHDGSTRVYSQVDPEIYDNVIMKYMMPTSGTMPTTTATGEPTEAD